MVTQKALPTDHVNLHRPSLLGLPIALILLQVLKDMDFRANQPTQSTASSSSF